MAPAGKNYIPSGRPASPGPLAADFFQQQIAKQRNNNYHSTSLRNMVATSVNRTALHPGGVQPGKSHTELEEELHETAHIDYDRVAIIANPSVPALYEDALVYETGTAITSSGALSAYSGAKTGRSPSDKRIVKEESSQDQVWWGPVNKPMSPDVSCLIDAFTMRDFSRSSRCISAWSTSRVALADASPTLHTGIPCICIWKGQAFLALCSVHPTMRILELTRDFSRSTCSSLLHSQFS
jgi:hypothetical protein